ncbi:MAG: DHHW family protein [Bacteroides sp.]|nr:DHHW family protein [Bacteroides sp.]MCM1446797.1 DHHW family protein [Bacteroides sp.]MCM1514926.1 DHHW family protein [Paraprevotella sp.]
MNRDKIYLTLVAVLFTTFTVVFDTFPRTRYSELEKREPLSFPVFSSDSLWSGAFADGVGAWFSDSQPFRDDFMTFSMVVKDWATLKMGNDNVTFHAATEGMEDFTEVEDGMSVEEETEDDERNPEEYVNRLTANEKAKVANAGIVIIGKDENVRALMCFGGSAKAGTSYARACNKYKQAFPDVNVYCMVVPSAAAYYMPEKVSKMSRDQSATIRNIYNHLDSTVQAVDIYTVLGEHAAENIYLRTDHHWSPLGAYYAARKFAEVADVPFHDLDEAGYYSTDTVHRFVGTMYGYSQDIAVKKAPEDFIYYMPLKAEYETTFQNYTIDENYQITSVGRSHKEAYFKHFKDGSSMAYSTFMGGDTKLTQVRTNVGNGRRLVILKDSYGNALPGYLFYSFEEIHVVDGRYFTHNMKRYVRENGITDILFANNIFQACGGRYRAYEFFLTMPEGSTDNPSTSFYKNRTRGEAKVAQDSMTMPKKDSAKVPSSVPMPSAVPEDEMHMPVLDNGQRATDGDSTSFGI